LNFKAAIYDDVTVWVQGNVKLLVKRGEPYGDLASLMSDGTWTKQTEGTYVADSGITLPRESIQAIYDACAKFLGKEANHAVTEAGVLREWLKSEKDRVDGFLVRGVQS
jgi:hypothetical protein